MVETSRWNGLVSIPLPIIPNSTGQVIDLLKLNIWKSCEHPKTPENTIAHGAKSIRCRYCHAQRERDRYRQNKSSARHGPASPP